MPADRHNGACHCGAVQFEAIREPARVGLCHCIDCRKDTGAPFAGFAAYANDRVGFSGDETRAYQSSSHMRRHFCRTCGSSIFLTEKDDDLIYLNLGVFDDADSFTPAYELWTVRKLHWVPDMPNMKSYTRQ